MTFTFGREERIGGWLRGRPKSFLDWEKIEGVLTPELCDQHRQEEGRAMVLHLSPSRGQRLGLFLVFHFQKKQTLSRSFHAGLSTVARTEK